MKIAGWVCLVIGVVSFLGAASAGDGLLGPTFFVALGVFFLYMASNREEQKDKVGNASTDSRTSDNRTSLDEVQSRMSLRQREAAICLMAYFAGFSDAIDDPVPTAIVKQGAAFYGMPHTPDALARMMNNFLDADTLMHTVTTISYKKGKEFLLLSCYDLAKHSLNLDARDLLFKIANDMGYDRQDMLTLINSYS